MKKNSKELYKDIDDFFAADFTPNQKAWSTIHNFYHYILTEMKKEGIKRADIATKLSVSPAAVSKLLNKTPNISLRKMVELADSVGLDIKLTFSKNVKEEYAANIHYGWLIKSDDKVVMCADTGTVYNGEEEYAYYKKNDGGVLTVNERISIYGG